MDLNKRAWHRSGDRTSITATIGTLRKAEKQVALELVTDAILTKLSYLTTQLDKPIFVSDSPIGWMIHGADDDTIVFCGTDFNNYPDDTQEYQMHILSHLRQAGFCTMPSHYDMWTVSLLGEIIGLLHYAEISKILPELLEALEDFNLSLGEE